MDKVLLTVQNMGTYVRSMLREERAAVKRLCGVVFVFYLFNLFSAKLIGYFIVEQRWTVQDSNSKYTKYPDPSFWDGELSPAAWAGGFVLAIALLGTCMYLFDKSANLIKTGRLSATTAPAMAAAAREAINELGVAPKGGIWHFDVSYRGQNNAIGVLCNGNDNTCGHNVDANGFYAISPFQNVLPKAS